MIVVKVYAELVLLQIVRLKNMILYKLKYSQKTTHSTVTPSFFLGPPLSESSRLTMRKPNKSPRTKEIVDGIEFGVHQGLEVHQEFVFNSGPHDSRSKCFYFKMFGFWIVSVLYMHLGIGLQPFF